MMYQSKLFALSLLTAIPISALAQTPPLLELVEVVTGYDEPTFVTSFPNDPNLLVIVERAGKIKLVNTSGPILYSFPSGGLFLDLTDRVHVTGGNAQDGLTGFAFHPRFSSPSKRWVYAYFTSKNTDSLLINRSRVERYWVPTNNPHGADRSSAELIWENEDATCAAMPECQGFGSLHVAGRIHFDPDEGKLFIGVPDHSAPGAPADRKLLAQATDNYWGKMLRVNSDGTIPGNNPLAGVSGAKPEIWAYGLRNPYGFSFDSMTGDMWIGDVGQIEREEINLEPQQTAPFTETNYGWPCREGVIPGPVSSGVCSGGVTAQDPIHDYGDAITPSAVLGGYVYRGTDINWDEDVPKNGVDGLELRYFFADHIQNKVWSLSPNDSLPYAVIDHTLDLELDTLLEDGDHIFGFGQDSSGELYLVTVEDVGGANVGTIYRIEEE